MLLILSKYGASLKHSVATFTAQTRRARVRFLAACFEKSDPAVRPANATSFQGVPGSRIHLSRHDVRVNLAAEMLFVRKFFTIPVVASQLVSDDDVAFAVCSSPFLVVASKVVRVDVRVDR